MNKFGMVLGVAAVATLAGCKDPDYKYANAPASQNEVKSIETTPVEKPVVIEAAPAPKCKCAPGTKHTKPCACGTADCMCIVETKPVITANLSKPAATETTEYIVQNGDYLAKISKKYNVTIAAIKRANPQIKGDVIRVGQKIKIPGKVDVGAQSVPANAVAPVKSVKAVTPYVGETKEYVVKSGDTLGAVAYGNGCTIRQLKELNGLTKDSIRVGQKLKVPAAGKTAKVAKPAAKAVATAKAADPAAKPVEVKVAEAKPVEAKAAEEKPVEVKAEEKPAEEAKPAEPAATTTYVVQEGDDMTGISIRWGVSAAAIRELNNLPDDAQLTRGQVIRLPADAQQ